MNSIRSSALTALEWIELVTVLLCISWRKPTILVAIIQAATITNRSKLFEEDIEKWLEETRWPMLFDYLEHVSRPQNWPQEDKSMAINGGNVPGKPRSTSEQTYSLSIGNYLAFFWHHRLWPHNAWRWKNLTSDNVKADMQMLDLNKEKAKFTSQIPQARKRWKYISWEFGRLLQRRRKDAEQVLNRPCPAVNQELIEIAKRLQKKVAEGGIDGW